MLKRLVRHRLFLTVLTIVAVVAALATPIRHDYNTQLDQQHAAQAETTNVYYGVPFSWLMLSKEVDVNTNKTLMQQTTKDVKKLTYDLLSYAAVLLVIGGATFLDKRVMPHANFGN